MTHEFCPFTGIVIALNALAGSGIGRQRDRAVSTASLVLGVAAAHADILITGLVAEIMSMATV
jgi:hypothetical protein